MKRVAVFTLVLAAATMCLAQQDNLLLNGGFEEVSLTGKATLQLTGKDTEDKDKYPKGHKPLEFGKLVGWRFQCWGAKAGEVALDNETAASGKQSLKVTLPTAKHTVTVRQMVKGVEAGATYQLTFKAKRAGDFGKARVRLYPYPVKKATDTTFRKLGEADDKGFATCSLEYTVPEGGKNLLVILSVYGGKQEQTWWIDDMVLVKK